MKVQIVIFPETRVASIEHHGPPALEHDTARKLVAWKLENRLLDPLRHRHYGLHYSESRTLPSGGHRVDFCLSFDGTVDANSSGIIAKVIPRCRCAYARDIGSRANNKAAAHLFREWLPASGEMLSGYPMIFHYVNVGPTVREEDMITDVYLPLT